MLSPAAPPWSRACTSPLTCVACPAMAHDLLRVPIPVAGSSKVPPAARAFGAGAGPALAPVGQAGVPMEASNAPAGRRGNRCILPEWRAYPPAHPRLLQTHRSQCSPPVWSRQPRQAPVWGSHSSACPWQTQGRQLGNPHWPRWQRSQRSPNAPARQGHCPLVVSHRPLSAPSGLHWQAGDKVETEPGRGFEGKLGEVRVESQGMEE